MMKQKSKGQRLLEAARASRQKQGSNKRLSQIVGKPNDRAKFAKTNLNG